MLHIHLSNQCRDDAVPKIERVSGDRLRINGDLFNFNPLSDGDSVMAADIPCEWIEAGSLVRKIDGVVHITLILPHGPTPEPFQAFPAPIFDPPEGPVDLPFNTYAETTEEPAEGGTNVVVTTYRWHQEPQRTVSFIPAVFENEEAARVEP